MSKSIIIFGCGYIGGELATNFHNQGFKVTALTRNQETAEALSSQGIKNIITCDLDSNEWHSAIPQETSLAVNCVSSASRNLEGYKKSYIDGQSSIIEWAKSTPIKKSIVYTSSTSVYTQNNGEWVDESTSLCDLSPTAEILLEAENVLLKETETFARAYVLRLAGIYGPKRHHLLNQLKKGDLEFSGTGEAFLNLIHKVDACQAIEQLLLNPPKKRFDRFNLSDGSPAAKKDVVEWIATQINSQKPVFNPNKKSTMTRQSYGRSTPPNRKISNHKICEAIKFKPQFENYKEGYASLLKS